MGRRAAAVGAAAALLLSVLGCGGGGGGGAAKRATLLLDFTPNAVHAGLFSAVARGYDRDAGVRLTIRQPSSSTDAVKLLVAGRTDFAVLDIHDLALAREKGRDLVGVMALVQRPLAAVIAQPEIRRPRDLGNHPVGVTGLPSDRAVLDSTVRGDGGSTRDVLEVTIGFTAVPSLLARQVDAATAFWDVEGVAVRRRRPGMRIFRVDDFGAPPYPELVIVTKRSTLEKRAGLVRALRRAVARGYGFTLSHPAASLADERKAAPGLDASLLRAEFDAVRPVFTAPGGRFGELNPARLRAWAAWDVKFGILKRPPDVRRAFALG